MTSKSREILQGEITELECYISRNSKILSDTIEVQESTKAQYMITLEELAGMKTDLESLPFSSRSHELIERHVQMLEKRLVDLDKRIEERTKEIEKDRAVIEDTISKKQMLVKDLSTL